MISEPGMHTRGHASDAAWSRHMRVLAQQLNDAPPVPIDTRPRKERLIGKAKGHSDRADVQAARSICDRNGWEY
jgi:hypothetical protein